MKFAVAGIVLALALGACTTQRQEIRFKGDYFECAVVKDRIEIDAEDLAALLTTAKDIGSFMGVPFTTMNLSPPAQNQFQKLERERKICEELYKTK